jgi:glycosyltransferase involved in cell wall biosynthesis
MRILNVIQSVNPIQGGPAEGLRQLAGAVRALGHTIEVLSLDAPGAPWLGEFPARTFPIGPVKTTYGYCPRLVPWLKQHAHEFDAVIIHGLWQYHGFAVWRALHGSDVPYFMYFHGMLDPWFKHRYPFKHLKKWLYWPWADYRVSRDAKAVLFTASEEARLAAKSFWLYRVKPSVVGYGLALDGHAESGRAEDFQRAFPETNGKRIVLFLGRIHPKKGCDLLVEAFAKLASTDPTLHLVMAGPDQTGLMAGLKTLAAHCGITDRVTWTGMLQGDIKWGSLRAAEVFSLPSHQENFGIAVAEALAVGLPVLISDRVNIWREIVDDGAGLADSDTLTGTIATLDRWLALAPEQRLLMRQRAEQCYQNRFRIDAAARRVITTIEPHLRGALALPALSA